MNKKGFVSFLAGLFIGVALMAACAASESQPSGEGIPSAKLIATIAESRQQLYEFNTGTAVCYITFPAGHLFCL